MNSTSMLVVGGLVVGLLVVGRRADPQEAARNRRDAVRPPLAQRPRLRIVDVTVHDTQWDELGEGHGPELEEEWAHARNALEEDRLSELLDLHVSREPMPGKFYLVRPEDTPETIARAVLSHFGAYTESQVLDYVYCFTSSPWNLDLYGGRSTSKRFPKRWVIPGFGQGLRAAFLPRNVDALAELQQGRKPRRSVDGAGKYLRHSRFRPASYGLLWLPPISPEQFALGVITCAPFSWDDGSSTINPDPELTELLQEAA